MTFIYLMIGCGLLVVSSLLLRLMRPASSWLSLVVFIGALICFIAEYGSIAGSFVSIASALLINLIVAFVFGKSISVR